MPKGRTKIPQELQGLLRSEWETVIEQASLGVEDTIIAHRCLIERMPQIDVAIELDVDRSTISYRLPAILEKVRRTANKLNIH